MGTFQITKFHTDKSPKSKKIIVVTNTNSIYIFLQSLTIFNLSLYYLFLFFFRLLERPLVSLINLIRKTVNYETLYYNCTVEHKKLTKS